MTGRWTLDFALDTDIRFGPGRRFELGEVAAQHGTQAFLVTGLRSFDANPFGSELLDALHRHRVEVVDRVGVQREPDDAQVRSVAARVRASGATLVVAVGGGSVLDLAKAANVVASGQDLARLLAGSPLIERNGLPLIALPTTAGTGSEVSRGAVILDVAARRKRAVRGRGVTPTVAIVDPELTISAGPRVTAEAGFDAAAHAIETCVSRAASRLNMALSAEALPLILASVPRAMADGSDLEARAAASYGAMLMGVNLATSTTCLPHRMQYPIGAATGTTHAVGVAALLPAWLRRTRVHAADALDELAVRSGIAAPGPPGDPAERLVARLEAWIDVIGMRTTLGALRIVESQVADLVGMVEGSVGNDPGPVGPADLRDLYLASLA